MKNYFIERDNGSIINLYARPQYEGQEFLSENDQELIDHFANQQATKDIEESRINEIEVEKNTVGLKEITIQDAYDKIDQIFEGATTIAQLRTATVNVLKKMIPYILR